MGLSTSQSRQPKQGHASTVTSSTWSRHRDEGPPGNLTKAGRRKDGSIPVLWIIPHAPRLTTGLRYRVHPVSLVLCPGHMLRPPNNRRTKAGPLATVRPSMHSIKQEARITRNVHYTEIQPHIVAM